VEVQQTLQGDDPLFTKPKLTENLLKKPPFRFIHDCISGVQKTTGFGPGLFSDGEMDAKAVAADKEAKNVYLSKIIQCVSLVLGEAVIAKPQKIMAGLEPENTSAFLIQLARAARQSRDTDQGAGAVQQVLGDGAAETAPESASEAPPPPQEAPPPVPEPEEAPLPPPAAPEPQMPAAPAAEEKKLERASSRGSGRRGESRDSNRSREKDRSREDKDRGREEKEKERRDRKDKERKERKREEEEATRAPDPPSPERPPTAQRMGGMRPQSARRGPPRAGSRPQDNVPKENLVPTEGPKLFVEGEKEDDDDVEVVTESEPVFGGTVGNALDGEGQGALVKDILDAQKQLAQDSQPQAEEEEASTGTGIVLKRRGSTKLAAQPAVAKASDLGALRTSIQTLCQSAMPLGKSMDYLQEDLENMKKELKFWMNEYRLYQAKLAEQQRYTEDLLNPQATLADVDNQIRQAKERIKGMKAQVLRNDDTIGKLLGMVVSGSR